MKKLWQSIVVFFCSHEYKQYPWLGEPMDARFPNLRDKYMCAKCGDICATVAMYD